MSANVSDLPGPGFPPNRSFEIFDTMVRILPLTISTLPPLYWLHLEKALPVAAGTQREIQMNALRKSSERGFADHGLAESFHTFFVRGLLRPKNMGSDRCA